MTKPRRPHRRARRVSDAAVVLVGLILVFGLDSLSAQAAPSGRRAAPVKVVAAEIRPMAPRIRVAATVVSRDRARLFAEVAGRLTQVAEVGTRIEEGRVVARIDQTLARLRVDELEAAVERERARLGFFDGEVKRLKRLARQNNAAITQLDQTRSDREVARNELRIAQVRLAQAREELRRHELRAPFTGVVVERLMRRGERASVGDPVVQLRDTEHLELQAWVPLASRNYVTDGDLLTFTSGGREYSGPVRTLVAAGDDRSRLLELRVALPTGHWTAGQSLRLYLPTAKPRDMLTVPRDALVLRRNGAFVFRIDTDNQAQRVPVTLGVASGDRVAVNGALKPGDRVVIRGGERLRPGTVVKILGETK